MSCEARKRRETDAMEPHAEQQTEASTEKLLQDLRTIVRDAEALLRAGANDLSERGMAAREKLEAALEVAKAVRRRVEQQVKTGAKATDRLVREHPYEALGAAFGLGLVLGLLARRR